MPALPAVLTAMSDFLNFIKERRMIFIGAGAALLAILLIAAAVHSLRDSAPVDTDVSRGIRFLETLEAEPAENVENTIKEIRQQKLAVQRDELRASLLNGEADVWSMFEDYVLLGDSRAVGFSYYGFLADDRVFAEGGATIRYVETRLDDIRALNPSSIFLCFGLNDVSIGFWDTPEDYAAEYREVIDMLLSEIPGCTVYVSSILPARDPAFETAEVWRQIPQFSQAVGEMCADAGYPFVNNDEIAETYANLWDIDGIHLQQSFYQYWGTNLMLSVFETHQEEEEAA